jgi:hypothetical protein
LTAGTSPPILPLRHRGKEGRWIDQREAGVADPGVTHTEYCEPGEDLWQTSVQKYPLRSALPLLAPTILTSVP